MNVGDNGDAMNRVSTGEINQIKRKLKSNSYHKSIALKRTS